MNKYELYKEMRRELAEAYKREIEQVHSLTSGGGLQIANGTAGLKVDEDGTMAAQGEARKILREELNSTLKVILERYLRNLRTEASNHGIQLDSIEIASSVTEGNQTDKAGTKASMELSGDSTSSAAMSAPAPNEAAPEDPFDTLIRDIEEEYSARENAAT